MKQRIRYIAIILSLIFLFNEISQGLHFLFFHHHGQHLTASTPTLGNEGAERSCPYENAAKMIGEAFSISHFHIFLHLIESIYLTGRQDFIPVKNQHGHHLRAPPATVFLL